MMCFRLVEHNRSYVSVPFLRYGGGGETYRDETHVETSRRNHWPSAGQQHTPHYKNTEKLKHVNVQNPDRLETGQWEFPEINAKRLIQCDIDILDQEPELLDFTSVTEDDR